MSAGAESLDDSTLDPSRDTIVPITGVAMTGAVGQVGIVAASNAENRAAIQRRTTSGTVSRSSVTSDGAIDLELVGKADAGADVEARVAEILRDALAERGRTVGQLQRPEDDRGDDRVLEIDGRRVGVQITTVVPDTSFFRPREIDASVQLHADRDTVTRWIVDAISKKNKRYPESDRRSRILALDCDLFAVIGWPPAINSTSPEIQNACLGWSGVWLIGPTAETSVRLTAR
jgi:hypothetical protein